MMRRKDLAQIDENILLADGFDEAIIGYCHRLSSTLAIYDYFKCIEILMRDMTEEEAVEYFDYNVQGSWFGEATPIFAILEK